MPSTSHTLSRYLDAIGIRTCSHTNLIDFALSSSRPVINRLSDLLHPCQALGDMMTVLEKKGKLKGINLSYIGDGNNVANSLIEASSMMGINLKIACPKGFEPDTEVLKEQKASAKSEIKIVRDIKDAATGADVLYTDVWISMGQEKEEKQKKKKFKAYQLNRKILSYAKKDAIVLHCLPAHRGEEITDDVIDSPQSAVFDQAENRLHTQKALLEFLLSP